MIPRAQSPPQRLSLFPSLLCTLSTPPSLTIKPCIKDSYGTYSVFRIYYAPPPPPCLSPPAPCSFCPLPFPLTHYPHPLHIGEFPLIRILRANPPQLLFPLRINVLTLGEENNRLRGGKTKGLFVADVLFWIPELVFCLSRHRSFSPLFSLAETDGCLSFPSPLRFLFSVSTFFSLASSSHFSLPDTPSVRIHPSDHLRVCFFPLYINFSI